MQRVHFQDKQRFTMKNKDHIWGSRCAITLKILPVSPLDRTGSLIIFQSLLTSGKMVSGLQNTHSQNTHSKYKKTLINQNLPSRSIFDVDFSFIPTLASYISATPSLREKCPYSEFFWSVFSRYGTEYGIQSLY